MVTRADEVRAHAAFADLLAPHGIRECGLSFACARTWTGPDARPYLTPDGHEIAVAHDEREAPYAVAAEGGADDSHLLSLTDEDDVQLIAWTHVPAHTDVLGIGVDLASTYEFADERGETFNHLLFTPGELAWVRSLEGVSLELACAWAFSAKEAAFKSLAAPLRRWYATHTEELAFEVRDFELSGDTHEVGTARRGAAQRAMRAMGVSSIELARCQVGSMALTVACATGA